jgi:hypothetical protein
VQLTNDFELLVVARSDHDRQSNQAPWKSA